MKENIITHHYQVSKTDRQQQKGHNSFDVVHRFVVPESLPSQT